MEVDSTALLEHGHNRLLNGNFEAVEKTTELVDLDVDHGGDDIGVISVDRVDPNLTFAVTASGIRSIGHWLIAGADAVVDIDPIVRGVRRYSFDSGHLVRIRLGSTDEVVISQEIEDIEPFRGKPLTVLYSGTQFDDGVTRIQTSVDFGTTEVVAGADVATAFGEYRRVAHPLEAPLDLTKLEVKLTISGRSGSSVGISGIVLALGGTRQVTPYVDSPAGRVIPSGAVILLLGAACPPGYVAEEEELFLVGMPSGANTIKTIAETTGLKIQPTNAIGHDDHSHRFDGAFELTTDVLGNRFAYFDTVFNHQANVINPRSRIYTPFAPPILPASIWLADSEIDYVFFPEHQHDVYFSGGTTLSPHRTHLVCRKI